MRNQAKIARRRAIIEERLRYSDDSYVIWANAQNLEVKLWSLRDLEMCWKKCKLRPRGNNTTLRRSLRIWKPRFQVLVDWLAANMKDEALWSPRPRRIQKNRKGNCGKSMNISAQCTAKPTVPRDTSIYKENKPPSPSNNLQFVVQQFSLLDL
ncbi:unnamed protein product, partial [Mesorhabditis spiculigera]